MKRAATKESVGPWHKHYRPSNLAEEANQLMVENARLRESLARMKRCQQVESLVASTEQQKLECIAKVQAEQQQQLARVTTERDNLLKEKEEERKETDFKLRCYICLNIMKCPLMVCPNESHAACAECVASQVCHNHLQN
jgi:hypothetical protein